MGRDRTKSPADDTDVKRDSRKSKSQLEPDPDSDSDGDEASVRSSRKRFKTKPTKSRSYKRRRSRETDSYSSSSDYDDDDSQDQDSESGYSEGSDSEDERRRRRTDRKRREEKREKRRREKEKEKDKKRKRKEEKRRKKKKKKKKKEKEKKKDKEKGKTGAVTSSWGKYGIIRETDMWNKRPEFTAWLAEVKQVNLESLANWEEKQLFKDFMEDHNTATFPSKKYYNLDAYYQHKMEKEMKKGMVNAMQSERTVFNDEEQRRHELMQERERIKQQQVEELKQSMQSGMAQAMKEQAQLREEMAYQYKLGNFEAAAAIQRRLDPDVAM